jgi:hypothetical protein
MFLRLLESFGSEQDSTMHKTGILLVITSALYGQTIAVTPVNSSVGLGQTLQFTAQVTGLANTAVTWSVAGVVGGNATSGKISTSGLYTAPSQLPGQNPVQVTASSAASPTVKSSTYVNILSLGPTITSVTPNPLPLGTYTVTVTGTGIQANATVMNNGVQLVTTKVQPPTSVTATGWQGPAASTTIWIKNPGSTPSNTLVVPVGGSGGDTKYSLTVVNGMGSGSYAAGAVVTIAAGAAPAGQSFRYWTGATVASPTALTTTLTMPAANTTVTATYSAVATTYSLTVVNGSGSGNYAAGAVVNIAANTPQGKTFQYWTGSTVANPTGATTTLTMPAANTTVTANYSAVVTTYSLTVVNGSGSGNYAVGAVVTIGANTPPQGKAFQNWTGATVANPTASATTLTMPAANTTVTANYYSPTYSLTVVNGTGGGSYSAGTVVTIAANSPPQGQFFQSWSGAAVADPKTTPTTLTMPASNVTVTANYAAPSAIPYPVTTHPRLWITQNDLPRLQSWAVATNPVYTQGMVPLLNQAINVYKNQFYPGGAPNPKWPDPGDVQGYTPPSTEQYALIFAFQSLIDPSPAARVQYAQYARNLIMYAMNQAALGHLANAPFRDPMFAVYNRANGSGEQWPLIVDWIYSATDPSGNAILTAADKATIRSVFMLWANDCLNAYTTGGDHPAPIGAINSAQLLPNNLPYRMAANNYYLGHARLLTMMSLSIDPSDDPPVNPSVAPSQLGNTLRSYIQDATGAWLYQEFAMFGDPATAASGLGVPGSGAGFGLASGGLPPEGMLYGHSYAYILSQLLALQTAGFNNVNYSGPQVQLIGAPLWDRYVTGFISSLTPTAKTFASESWLGPVYQYGSYGDLLRLYVTPDFMASFALLAVLDQQNGSAAHLNAARWFAVNASEGGPGALMTRISQPWSWSTTLPILYFMLLDPAAPPATDPRPSFPNVFYDPGAGRIVAHSDWSPNGTMFDYRASWISINHQLGDGGQFELYRNGEWLTKEMSNYDNNALGMTTVYHNTLALQNWSANGTPGLQWYESGEWANGSQWMEGLDAGDPHTVTSSGPGYVYAASDLTNLFNRPNYWTPSMGATDISQVTRSILWLNHDYIVVYDRATSLHPNLFKRFNLSLVTNPSINGRTATEVLPSGQRLFLQTLLPQNAAMAARFAAGDLNPISELEPTKYILTVQDPNLPTDTRFLHVLQGADAGAAMVPATYLQSTAGTSFDGAVFGSTAVYFPVSATAAFAGTTLPAPSGVQTIVVAGLTPNASYGASVNGNAVAIVAGGAATADAAGLLRLTF